MKIQEYFEKESLNQFRTKYRIKDEAYIGTHWDDLNVKNNDITYFNSFGVEHIPNEIIKFIGNKNIKTNILRIQAYDSIICGYFCIRFINFMLNGKSLIEYTNLFSPYDFKKNDDIILFYSKDH